MPEGDGFEVLRRITHRPRVIFTTAYDRYAVPAFDVRSVDYLLKPFSRERFAAAMTRAREALQAGTTPAPQDILRLLEEIRAGLERSGRAASSPAPPEAWRGPAPPDAAAPPASTTAPLRIPVRRANKIVLLEPSEILWFEAEGDDRLRAGRHGADAGRERTPERSRGALAPSFFRTHRSFLVNVSHIGEILPEEGGTARIVMKDEARTGCRCRAGRRVSCGRSSPGRPATAAAEPPLDPPWRPLVARSSRRPGRR